ncbi:MAG: hypothetical protein M0000_01645 [Actinomycetota bacterium]|nr:hypothetical protein [Actinomycetota bacterium]
MGEYLQLVTDTLTDTQLHELLARELAAYPRLLEQFFVGQRTISTKLATCEHVFFTFEEMVALFRFIEKHTGVLRYGPDHEFNETPEDILRDRSSLYLGPFDQRLSRHSTRQVDPELASTIEHNQVWRKTKRTLSKNGRWYRRKVRRHETSGVPGNPNGYRTACPNSSRQFRALKVGFAWDASTGMGREIYRCRACKALFNLGETPATHLADLAAQLNSHASVPSPQAVTGSGSHPPPGDGSRPDEVRSGGAP